MSDTHSIAGHSIGGYLWQERPHNARDALAIAQTLGVPELIGRALASRGVAVHEAAGFLKPTLREFLPDPFHLKDMRKAAERVAQAIKAKETIAIFGDYDVDGATSSALLLRYLRAVGLQPLVHIPDRMKEGYGPNTPALLALKERGATLIITVDCGTMAFAPLLAAKEAGVDVVVLDHHKGDAQLPDAYAVVNPNRADETSPHTQLAAVGVTFLLLVALNKLLKEVPPPVEASLHSPRKPPPAGGRAGEGGPKYGTPPGTPLYPPASGGRVPWGGQGINLPDLMGLLDIVALGTICDVVPLTGANRALVTQGLKVMRARGNVGICAAMDVAGLSEVPGTYHAGFIIGPRINAGGRVGKSDLGVRLLSTEDELEARDIAAQLNQFNAERKAIESLVQEEAMQAAQALPPEHNIILVARAGWHPGVIGIVAGRLKDHFGKPTAVIALNEGIGKASARSVNGVDLGTAIIAATHAGLLVGGGGHAMAAGFTVEENQIEALQLFLNHYMAKEMTARGAQKPLFIDGTISLKGITPELVRLIEQAGPFGAGNPSVRLQLSSLKVVNAQMVGDGHVRVIFTEAGLGSSSGSLKAMAFRCAETPMGQTLLNARGQVLHVAGQARINQWQGRETVDFFIDDVALAAETARSTTAA